MNFLKNLMAIVCMILLGLPIVAFVWFALLLATRK